MNFKYLLQFRLFLAATLFLLAAHSPVYADSDVRDAVVKVFVTSNRIDFYRPWQSRGSSSASGSGFVISGNRIMTNAHVVSDNTFIQVRKESDPKKYTAKLESIGHACDLAILSVEDESFFEGIAPVEFGELPRLQDQVIVIGFPRGGDKLSITEGVVSRVEIVPYTQSAKHLLAIQIDAAINPGNSGGPVLKDGKLVGVAMQIISNSQNIGYMIPMPIVQHFLDDLKDGVFDGFPALGIEYVNTENESLREYYSLDDDMGGVLITNVFPFSPADKNLKISDVILEIDDVAIGVDGTYGFRGNERMSMVHLVNKKQLNDNIKLKISRNGKLNTMNIKLEDFPGLVPLPRAIEKPSYYIYGGLVFTPLSSDLLKSWGGKWWEKAPIDFLNYLVGLGKKNLNRKDQIVTLLTILPDDITVGYHKYNNKVISKVNGKVFNSFREFVQLVEKNEEEYLIFTTDQGVDLIIKNEDLEEVTQDILERNNIQKQYSDDVKAWIDS